MKVWDRALMELATPGSAVRLASVARHVTNCAMQPGPKFVANCYSMVCYKKELRALAGIYCSEFRTLLYLDYIGSLLH